MNSAEQADDRFERVLAQVHQEIAASIPTPENIDTQNVSESADSREKLPEELRSRLESARKVIELLHRVRPSIPATADTVKAEITRSVDAPGHPVNATLLQAADNLPTAIGRFEIRRLLGKGGYGLVFEAYDPELNRAVALKVPTFDSLIQSESLARFHRESRAVAALSHPNIVPVYEVGNDGPISFIAAEFIAGKDLARWVAEHGHLQPKDAAAVVAKLADTMQHAHDRDVLHRDLKPANILVERDTHSDHQDRLIDPASIRVTDFGLAKMVGEDDGLLTRTGSQIGTPAFSAPEQLGAGTATQPTRPDEKADVYSLGATLFFLLTGSPPFESENLLELLKRVESLPPKLPDSMPAELAAICYKALEKVPADRYSTAYALGRDLQNFVEGRPVTARPASWLEKSIKTARRNPLVTVLITATLLSTMIGAGVSLWSARQAQLAAQAARERYLESKQVVDDYYVRVSRDPMFMSAAFEDQKRKLLDTAKQYYIQFLEENADDESLLIDLIRTRIYLAYAELGSYHLPLAQMSFNESLGQLEAEFPNDVRTPKVDWLRALCLVGLGTIADRSGNYQDALGYLDSAASLYESLLAEMGDDREFLQDMTQAYHALSRHHRGKGEPVKANEYSLKQHSLLASAASIRNVDPVLENSYAMVLGDQSLFYRDQGEIEKSLDLLNQSIEVSQQLIANEPNPVWFAETAANSFYRRGVHHVRAGDFQSAWEDARCAVRLFESLSIHNRTAEFLDQKINARNLLAICFEQTGDSQNALRLSEENLSDARELVSQHPDQVEFQISLVTKLFQLASALTDQGDLEQATSLSKELESRLTELSQSGVRHPLVASIGIANLTEQGRILHRQDKFEPAVEKFDQAVNQAEGELELNPGRPDLLGVLQTVFDNRSYSHAKLGSLENAIADRRRSMKLDQHGIAYQQLALAELLAIAGKLDETREIVSDLDFNGAVEELSEDEVEMKLALIHAAIAAELDRHVVADKTNSDLIVQQQSDLDLAESHFLRAFELGYFSDRPKQIESISERPELGLLLQLPSIKQILDRLQWTPGKPRSN